MFPTRQATPFPLTAGARRLHHSCSADGILPISQGRVADPSVSSKGLGTTRKITARFAGRLGNNRGGEPARVPRGQESDADICFAGVADRGTSFDPYSRLNTLRHWFKSKSPDSSHS